MLLNLAPDISSCFLPQQLQRGHTSETLYGLPDVLLDKLLRAQNAAARVVVKASRYDHVTPILQALHWLPLRYRIQYKIILTTYKASHLLAPSYLSDLLEFYHHSEHCDRHQSPYWLYTGHISASSVIKRSASLLLTYGTIYHAICEHVIHYTSSKDSLKLIYSKELFTHEH